MAVLWTDIGIIFIGIVTLIYLYFTWTFDYWKKRGLPFIKPIPIFGNFKNWAFLKVDAGTLFKQLYEKSKGTGASLIGIWVFRKPAVVILQPELIKQVLVKDFAHFADRSTQTDSHNDPLGCDNLFFGKNPHWKYMRVKLTHLYSSAKMRMMFTLMNDIGNDLEESIERAREKPIELKDLSGRFTTDVIATTAYGLKANALLDEKAPFNDFRKRLLDFRFFRSIEFMSIFFMQELAKLWKAKVFETDRAEWIRNVFWKTIKDRENSKEVRNDLIGTLIQLKDQSANDENIKFTGDSLVAQAAIFFTAGNESSSTTMSFLLYKLALHPEKQEKLAKEIRETLKKYDGNITYEGLHEMAYLEMCIKEILRLYPPLPFLDRECTKRYKVPNSDVIIEKGVYAYIPVMALHLDPDYFEDPNSFKPERFDKENSDKIVPFTYLPFGEGPRICIGERFGMLQSRLGMIHVLRRFKVQTCSKTQIPLRMQTLSLSPTAKDGIYLEFVPRD